MKKAFFFSAAFAAAFAAASFAGNTVSAANTEPQTTTYPDGLKDKASAPASTATFTVDAGDYGDKLLLTEVPSFVFDNVDLSTLVNTGKKWDTNNNGAQNLTVVDLTGSNAGWTVTAKAASFVGGSTLDGGLLTLSTEDGSLAADPSFTAGSDTAGTILTAAPNNGQGTTTKAVSASLDFGKQAKATTDAYTSAITWTVSTAQPAGSDTVAG